MTLKLFFSLMMALLLSAIVFYIPALGLSTLFKIQFPSSTYVWWGLITYCLMAIAAWWRLTYLERKCSKQ